MPKGIFRRLSWMAIEILGRFSTPFLYSRCKQLFLRPDFWSGRAVSKVGCALGLSVAFGMTGQADAKPQCWPRVDILRQLAEKYHETIIARGVTSGGSLLEITAPADGATWTAIVTSPDGISCPVATGDGWQALTPTPPPDPGA